MDMRLEPKRVGSRVRSHHNAREFHCFLNSVPGAHMMSKSGLTQRTASAVRVGDKCYDGLHEQSTARLQLLQSFELIDRHITD